jgi:hypothetical protein
MCDLSFTSSNISTGQLKAHIVAPTQVLWLMLILAFLPWYSTSSTSWGKRVSYFRRNNVRSKWSILSIFLFENIVYEIFIKHHLAPLLAERIAGVVTPTRPRRFVAAPARPAKARWPPPLT